jgi:cold shock CspA family protein
MSVQAKLTGTVKNYFEEKGFGFIIGAGDRVELFFHIRDVVSGEYEPCKGDRVTFVIGTGKNGRQRAQQVEILSK